MVYTAFSLAPPSLADHLTLGNLCRHAATEAVFCDQRIHNLIAFAAAAVATFTSNSALKFICTTGFAVLAGLRAKNEIQKVKACAVQLHKDTSQINQRHDQFVQEISRAQQELNSFKPWLDKAKKNPKVDPSSEVKRFLAEADKFLAEANGNLKRIQINQDKNLNFLMRGNKHKTLCTYAIPLMAASVFFPSNSNLIFRVGVHFGLMCSYLYHNFHLSRASFCLSMESCQLPRNQEQVSHNLQSVNAYLKMASEAKTWGEQKNIREAAEDFLKRLDARLSTFSSALYQLLPKKILEKLEEKTSKLASDYKFLKEEGYKLIDNPLKSPRDVDAFKNKCENLQNSIKEFFQQNGENEKFHTLRRKFAELSNQEKQFRLNCFNEIERHLSSHPDFAIISPLLQRFKQPITAPSVYQEFRLDNYHAIAEKRIWDDMDAVGEILESLLPTKFMTSNQITGGAHFKSKKF